MKIAVYIDEPAELRGICRFTNKLIITIQSLYPDIEFYAVNGVNGKSVFNIPYIPPNRDSLLYNDIQYLVACNNGRELANNGMIQDLFKSGRLQTVSTIHDVIDVICDDNNEELATCLTDKNIRMKNCYQRAINYSDIIFTVSEYSKNDLLKYLDVPQNLPVHVIYPAPLLKISKEDKAHSKIGESYFLYNGGYCHRKGILQLLYNFIELKINNKIKSKLVLTGNNFLNNCYVNNLMCYGIDKGYVINKGFVSDEELSSLYKNALAMVYPSSYEGFGIPLVEAMKTGCPIITCYNSSIIEVCGEDGAYYINKFDSDSFQKAFMLFESKSFKHEKEKLIKKGYENVKRFSWEETAHKFVKVLRENKKNTYIKDLKSLGLTLKETDKLVNRIQKFKVILDEKYELNLSDLEPTNHKKISIVIVTYNRGAFLDDTLKSLYNLNYPDFEVILVVGPCTDNTLEIIKKYEHDIKIAKCSVVNISVARNIGLAMACGDCIAFIDDDAVPEPNWLKQLMLGFKTNEVAGVSGDVYYEDGVTYQTKQCFNDRFDWENSSAIYLYPYSFHFNSVVGVNCIFKRECLLDIKGFDEQYEYHLEEIDLCARLTDYGYIVDYIEGASVYHKTAESHIRNKQKIITNWYVYGKNSTYFIKSYEKIVGEDLVNKAIDNMVRKYESILTDMYNNNSYTKEQFLTYIQDVKDGVKQGLKDAKRGPLLITQETLEKYKSKYKKFPNSSFSSKVNLSTKCPGR